MTLLSTIQQREKYQRECSHGEECHWKECPECREFLVRKDLRETIISLLTQEIEHLEGEKTLILGGGIAFPYQIENRPIQPQEEFFKGKVWHIVEQIARYQSVLDGLTKSV